MLTGLDVASYASAAVAFLFLSILLLTSWRGRLYGLLLTIASLTSAIWAATIAGVAYWQYADPMPVRILEILRHGTLTAFLLVVLGPFQHGEAGVALPKIRPAVVAVGLFYLACLAYIIFLGQGSPDDLNRSGILSSSFLVGVTMAIIGMILVEQYYCNTPREQRWGIKFICLGIGAVFVYDFYLYSDALLFRKINEDIWAARGWVNALVVPLIAISAARNPKWTVGIAVSRKILFYSSALFGAAIYLLLMSAAGYYIRFSGGSWGTVFQLIFLFGAAVLLVILLFSGTTRAWLKVFISKHFFSYSYDYREEWLRFTDTLSEQETELRIRVIRSLAQLVESPAGGLWYRSGQGSYQPIARWNIPDVIYETVDANDPFCLFLQQNLWVIDLYQYDSESQKYAAMVLPDWLPAIPGARWVVPLTLHADLIGFVVLTEPRSKITLNWEVRDLLKVAASQAGSYLAQHESAQALSTARQFESFNRMSTFIVHDIKNLIAQLSLLLTNAEKHKGNPEFQKDMFETLSLSVDKMKRLLEKLSNADKEETINQLLIDKILQKIVQSKSFYEPAPTLEIVNGDLLVKADRSRLERVLGHLVQNAIEATSRDGQVQVRLLLKGEWVVIEIRDTGCGMSDQFIQEKLFKPFESTKTAGMGIGVFESREYITELDGKIIVSSTVGQGTIFMVMLQRANIFHPIRT
ncbi:MAG: PEP-CTERM system histidine kinase PrsK [Nitrosomonas sp.]|nr:PEP-CTERM system histidine kinase PrsK [Nitrosomonas sp.]